MAGGQVITSGQGSVTFVPGVPLTGVEATFSTGTISPPSSTTHGLEFLGLAGTASPVITVPLSGSAATSAQGGFGVSTNDKTAALSGSASTPAAGDTSSYWFVPLRSRKVSQQGSSATRGLNGIDLTGSTGTLALAKLFAVSGSASVFSAGSFSAKFNTTPLSGSSTAVQSGTVAAPSPPAPAGTFSTLTLQPTNSGTFPYWAAIFPPKGQIPAGNFVNSDDDTNLRSTTINTWPDGSARCVIVAGETSVTSGVSKAINLRAGTATGTAMTATAIASVLSSVRVNAPGIADVTTSTFTSPTRSWWANQRLICCQYVVNLGSEMQFVVHATAFSGGRCFVEVAVENCKIDPTQGSPTARTAKDYTGATVFINGTQVIAPVNSNVASGGQGNAFPQTHNPYSRWIAAGWVGGTAPGTWGHGELEVTHDATSLQAHPLLFKVAAAASENFQTWVPPGNVGAYTSSGNMTFNGVFQAYGSDLYVPFSYGRFRQYDPGTGGEHPTISYWNKWSAHYVQSGDRYIRRSIIANALSRASFRTFYRNQNNGALVSKADIGARDIYEAGTWPGVEVANTDSQPLVFNVSHAPETSCLMAFMCRPSPVFIEQLQSEVNMFYLADQTFKGSFSYYNEPRGWAHTLRNIAHAMQITPTGDAFITGVNAAMPNLTSQLLAFKAAYDNGTNGNRLGLVYDYTPGFVDDQDKGTAAGHQWGLWQTDWLLMSMHFATKAEVFGSGNQVASDMTTATDWLARYPARLVNESIGGEWRHVGNHNTIGRIDQGTNDINSAPTWSEQYAYQWTADVPPARSGPWQLTHVTDTLYSQSIPLTTSDLVRDNFYCKVRYASIAIAMERGAPGGYDAWQTLTNNLANFSSFFLNEFSDDPRWGITPRPPFTASYTLPAPGQAIAMPVNSQSTATSAAPSGFNSDNVNSVLVGSFGAGVLVQSYSAGGAYVTCNTGGHVAIPLFGCLIFDFTTGRWSNLANNNGVPFVKQGAVQGTDVNSNGELINPLPTTQPYPAPGHQYRYTQVRESWEGGSAKGNVFFPRYEYVAANDAGLRTTHACDMTNGRFSPAASNSMFSVYPGDKISADCGACWDPVTKRTFVFPIYADTFRDLVIHSQSTNAWTYQTYGGSFVSAGAEAQFSWEFDVARRVLLGFGHQSDTMYAMDPAAFTGTPPNGLRILTTANGSLMPANNHRRWHKLPRNGCWYTWDGVGVNMVLYKMTPPLTKPGDTSGTWTFSTETPTPIGAAVVPPKDTRAGQGNDQYNLFFYVPTLGCFAWVSGADNQVWLINPQ